MTSPAEKLDETQEADASLPMTEERPRTRGECPISRPCPWVACKYHLYLDVHPRTGRLFVNFPDLEPWELAETCALDVARKTALEGEFTLEETGELMNLTRERVRQIEFNALQKLKRKRRQLT